MYVCVCGRVYFSCGKIKVCELEREGDGGWVRRFISSKQTLKATLPRTRVGKAHRQQDGLRRQKSKPPDNRCHTHSHRTDKNGLECPNV